MVKIIKFLKAYGFLLLLVLMLVSPPVRLWVSGNIQRVILKTGLLNPSTNQNEKEQVIWNFELIDESGKSFEMLRLEGKTVFINVWATWCPPCIAELPEIQQLYSKFKDEDILFHSDL
jgi:thiol-disulfide isomerase/thioredoxin